jgi:hypothetical protein
MRLTAGKVLLDQYMLASESPTLQSNDALGQASRRDAAARQVRWEGAEEATFPPGGANGAVEPHPERHPRTSLHILPRRAEGQNLGKRKGAFRCRTYQRSSSKEIDEKYVPLINNLFFEGARTAGAARGHSGSNARLRPAPRRGGPLTTSDCASSIFRKRDDLGGLPMSAARMPMMRARRVLIFETRLQ